MNNWVLHSFPHLGHAGLHSLVNSIEQKAMDYFPLHSLSRLDLIHPYNKWSKTSISPLQLLVAQAICQGTFSLFPSLLRYGQQPQKSFLLHIFPIHLWAAGLLSLTLSQSLCCRVKRNFPSPQLPILKLSKEDSSRFVNTHLYTKSISKNFVHASFDALSMSMYLYLYVKVAPFNMLVSGKLTEMEHMHAPMSGTQVQTSKEYNTLAS